MNGIDKISIPKTAMILAAGLGERMRPLTKDKPKALVEIAGKPLIAHLVEALAATGVEKFVINVHYQPAGLIDWIKSHPFHDHMTVSDESDRLLDTGGGVKKAFLYLGSAPFFVANCDSFFPDAEQNPFSTLARAWDGERMAALLLLKKTNASFGYDKTGDFLADPGGRLSRPRLGAPAPFAFTGLQILIPALFAKEQDEIFSLNRIYNRALNQDRLFGAAYPGRWFHIGTPAAFLEAEKTLKVGND